MRAVLFALVLLLVAQGAHAQEKELKEPFGATFYAQPDAWVSRLRAKFSGEDKDTVVGIAARVREKPKDHWLAWVNQLVNLSVGVVGLYAKDTCAKAAVAKHAVLRELGVAEEDLRLVYGMGPLGPHAVAAVRLSGDWRVLDNRHVVAPHAVPLDTEVRRFRAIRSF